VTDRLALDGLTVVVTGAGRGIGRSIAVEAGRSGARVALLARSADELELTAEEIRGFGREAEVLRCDVRDATAVDAALEAAEHRLGRIDGLVNAAGVSPTYVRAERIAEDDLDTILETNLLGPLQTCRAAGERMRRSGGGAIVNVASVGGVVALPRLAAYCASKGGLVGVTKTLAAAWQADGVRVNCIAPAYVRTAMSQGLLDHPEHGCAIIERTPMGRLGELTEVAHAALFLLSPAAGHVNGQTVCVDGGWTAV
jgi:NAD(P)-dependent dehydrogenase (short-subunit alcohol dehydrogenase family)